MNAPHILERRLVRRTRLVVGVNLTAAISMVVLLVGGLVFLVTSRQQDAASQRYLAFALQANRPGVAYSCLWLFTLRGSEFQGAEQAPPGFPLRATMRMVAEKGTTVDETVQLNRTMYRVHTERQGGVVHQAVFDLAYQRDDNEQLLVTLMAAGAAGLLGAAVVGAALSRRAINPLEESLDRQRRFVTDASHELRAPLTRLHTRAELILHRSSGLPEPVATELRRMVADTRELSEVVEDLLRTARLRAAPPIELVDLAAVAADLIAAETGRLEERGLEARLEVASERVVVPGIESSLRRLLSALLDNAIGHSRPGGRIVVSLDHVDQGRVVELVVADDGVGLDPGGDRFIFERFVRGTSGAGQRHGLGLALAREVVECHGGTISAAGEPGEGARFTVRLPAAQPSDPWPVVSRTVASAR